MDVVEDWVAFLARGDEDGGRGAAGGEGLGRRLLDFGRCGRGGFGGGGRMVSFDCFDGGGEVGLVSVIVIHWPWWEC